MSLYKILMKLEKEHDTCFEVWDDNFLSIGYYSYEMIYGAEPEEDINERELGLQDDMRHYHRQTNKVLMKIPPKELDTIIRLWEKTSDKFTKTPDYQLIDNIQQIYADLIEHCIKNNVYLPERVLTLYNKKVA